MQTEAQKKYIAESPLHQSIAHGVSSLMGLLRSIFIDDAKSMRDLSVEYEQLLIESILGANLEEEECIRIKVTIETVLALIESIDFEKFVSKLPPEINEMGFQIKLYDVAMEITESQFKSGTITSIQRAGLKNVISKLKRILKCADKVIANPAKYASKLVLLNSASKIDDLL